MVAFALGFGLTLSGCGHGGSSSGGTTTPTQTAAAAPTFSPAAGTYTSAQSVTLADATQGATIYYTTDGSTPTTASTKYTAAISLATAGSTTINAIAVAAGYTTSPVASATYVINIATGKPNYTYKNVQIVGGGFVDGLYFHPKSKGLMYARTDVGGAYRWNNVTGGDSQWVPLLDFVGRYQNGYQLGVESLGLDPNDATRLYIATGEYTTSGDKDYIFTSSDMGNTFTPVQLPFANGSNNNGRFAGERLSVDPANGKHIYFGTRVNGLYESNDQGSTWNQVSAFPVKGATGTSFDPGVGIIFEDFLTTSGTANSNTKTIYYGVSDPTTGLYLSNDGGQTFSAVAGQPTGYYLNAGVFDPNNRYLYLSYARQANVTGYQQTTACTSNCTSVGPGGVNDGQIWRYTLPTSTNPTGAWTNITPPLLSGETSANYVSNPYGFSGVTIDPSNPDTVMVTTLNKYYPPPFDDVFRSLDDGKTWVDFGANASRDDSLSPWLNFGQSTPDGGNWVNHAVVDPFNPAHIMYGDGQTIWQTVNGTAVDGVATSTTAIAKGNATDWTVGAQGVEETVILGLASPPSGVHLFSVMYDLGGFTHTDLNKAGLQQMNPEFTNGRSVDVAWKAPLNVVRVGDNTQAQGSASANQMVGFSVDGGVTWTTNTTLPSGVSQGQGSVAIAADGSTVLWLPIDSGLPASYTTDKGATWHASTGAPTQINQGYNRSVVLADRVNPRKFYLFTFQSSAASNDGIGTVYVSTDAGQTFTAAAAPLSNSYPTGIFASPAAEGDLWVTANNGLFHSTDSGATFATVYSFNNPTYSLGFGAPAAGQTYPAIYMIGQLQNDTTCTSTASSNASKWFTTPTNCIYRSTDGGKTFLHINDYAHQYSNANYIVGDPQVFGRYFLGTPGRGIIEADSPN